MKPQPSSAAHVVILVGIPGSGKSFFAEYFAKAFNAPIVNVYSIARSLDIDDSSAKRVGDLLMDELLKTGRTLIYEGPTSKKKDRKELVKKVIDGGYQPLLVWVQTETPTARSRVARKTHTGKRLSGSEFDAALRQFEPPTEKEKCLVISGKHTFTSQLRVVLKHLVGPRTAPGRPEPPVRQSPLR